MAAPDAKDRYTVATEFVQRALTRAGLENAIDRNEKERLVMAVEVELRRWTPLAGRSSSAS